MTGPPLRISALLLAAAWLAAGCALLAPGADRDRGDDCLDGVLYQDGPDFWPCREWIGPRSG
jgi:hypothetical protein